MFSLSTIGYEGTAVPGFLAALTGARIELLVDVRAVAMSRRPGFAKTALAANLKSVGIEYMHLRGLGTPADGRAAARSGRHDVMQRIFAEHMATDVAQADLAVLEGIVRTGRRTCILCFEADPAHCHRTLVARALGERIGAEQGGLTVMDLRPDVEDPD